MTVYSKLAIASGGLSLLCGFYSLRVLLQKKKHGKEVDVVESALNNNKKGPQKPKVAVDMLFFRRFMKLLRILVPGFLTPEVGFIVLVAAMMLARTYCDLWFIANTTKLEGIIISRNSATFYPSLFWFFIGMIPIAFVNNLLKYGLTELALCFRTRLTAYLYVRYLRGFTYYKLTNLDNRISNPDQLLTQDVERFSQCISDLYSNMSKPLLDILIYTRKLSGAIGVQGPTYMLGYLALSGIFLTWLRRPTGRYTVQEQKLEGEFRFVNSRLITNSEEIAFYQGNKKEDAVIQSTFRRLIDLLRRSMQFRFSMGIVDTMVTKYCATIVGFFVVSRPFLDILSPSLVGLNNEQLMQEYYKSGRMLMNLAGAVGRLVLAGRDLTRLAGFTSRVFELIEVLQDLNNGKYVRTMVNNNGSSLQLKPGSGKIITVDHLIRFVDVPLVTPNGDVLIEKLNFEVKAGTNVLVCGPNGCGKSSLFRTLGELWPLFGGVLHKPAKENLFYVPQRPYMTLGTLRDQVAYPHSKDDLEARKVSDDELRIYLQHVHLEYLVDRPGGWDATEDWMDVLSGGEKQRIAMARLFYHKPQFAILDECTSAVSVDVEGFMYKHCKKLGITLFTVSHRKTLWEYHEFVLKFDGRGHYEYSAINQVAEFGSA